MKALLPLAQAIDKLNEGIFRIVMWLVLIVTLISAGNAVIRYAFDRSSNAWLETQWYLFSAIFLFCAAYTLKCNEMVRIDVVTGRFTRRTQGWIDVFGTIVFLLPIAIMMIWLSWPVFMSAYTHNEMSSNAGGLPLWPARAMVPLGFGLLMLQGISELIKVLAFVVGAGPDPHAKEGAKTAEEMLADEIVKSRGEQA
ncbi:MAG TPA: TRAP transporter small permease subunit [Burkholderiaceae bacterium]|jgi:TRAP-type mannitol/chloroaromatic compound transport system permease small subunit|nr:TRAP transporter small permease subunit [Burkholderiaceae bacterium]HRZ00178.1 TRAP transporter small permease subunit [Burkholderiaceae bacterium]